MRIAVNGKTFSIPEKGGAPRFAMNLVRWMAEADTGVEIHVFVPQAASGDDPGPSDWLPPTVHVRTSRSPLYGGSAGRSVWEQVVLPKRVRRGDYAVLLNPTNSAPGLVSPGIPQVVVVHDAGFLNRAWFSRTYSAYVSWALRRAAALDAEFVTDSESAATQLGLGMPELRPLRVIPIDSDDPPFNLAPEHHARPYLLLLGSLNPRKNFRGALLGFRRFAERSPTRTDLLVVGGSKGIFREVRLGSSPDVKQVGYVEDDRRWALLAGARLLLMPSFMEGFGLPVLEALKVGTPVVASDIPAFRELFEGGVEFVDPTSPADIARGIERVITDADRRAELVRVGREIAVNFSGERTASAYLRLVERITGPSP